MTLSKLSKFLIFVALLVCISFQAFQAWKGIIKPWLRDHPSFILASAPDRGAIYYMGEDRARFMRFLDAYLPEDAEIVLPPRYVTFSNQSIMQNYLFPRAILSCFGEDLTLADKCLTDPQNFVLAVGDFPSAEQVPGRVFVAYPDGNKDLRGIYVPEGQVDALRVPSRTEYGKTLPVSIGALLTDVLVVGLLFLLGSVLVSLILGQPSGADLLELSIPLAAGSLTWLLFILSYCGIRLGLAMIFSAYFVLVLASFVTYYIIYKSFPRLAESSITRSLSSLLADKNRAVLLLFGLTLALVAAMTFLTVANGYSDFDSIANWSLKGYAIAGTGSIWAGAKWGGHVLSYPLNLPLSISIFKLADGDLMPGSKFIYALLTVSLLVGAYRFLIRHAVSWSLALLGILMLLTTPVFFSNSISGLANLPFTAYLTLGVLHSLEGLNGQEIHETLLGGLLLAFAAWTRPEGILFALLLLGLLYALAILILKRRLRPRLWAASFLPVLIIPVSWIVLIGGRNMGEDQIGQAIQAFIGQALRGNLGLEGVVLIWDFARKSFADISHFGLIVGAALLLVLLCIPLTRWYRDRFRLVFIALTVLVFLLPAGMFFVAYFREKSFLDFLRQSFERAYLPALTMSMLSAMLALTNQPRNADRPEEPRSATGFQPNAVDTHLPPTRSG
jgi:hypothetical protein